MAFENTDLTCPNCGSQLIPNTRFCTNCGCDTTQTKKCTNCGASIAPDAKFCTNCGSNLSASAKTIKKETPKKFSKSCRDVQDYVYSIASFASEEKLADADNLIKEAKHFYPNSSEDFDNAKKVGIRAQDMDFSYPVSCSQCGTQIKVFTGYCPMCGFQYIKLPKGDWEFDTPQEYEYRLRYLASVGRMEEATALWAEAVEHFPENETTYTLVLAFSAKK